MERWKREGLLGRGGMSGRRKGTWKDEPMAGKERDLERIERVGEGGINGKDQREGERAKRGRYWKGWRGKKAKRDEEGEG